MSEKLSQEFWSWKEAQDVIRTWIDAHPKQPIPHYLMERLERTQAAYERSRTVKDGKS